MRGGAEVPSTEEQQHYSEHETKRHWEEKGKRKNVGKRDGKIGGGNGYTASEGNNPAFFFGVDKTPGQFSGCSKDCSNSTARSTPVDLGMSPGVIVPTILTGQMCLCAGTSGSIAADLEISKYSSVWEGSNHMYHQKQENWESRKGNPQDS